MNRLTRAQRVQVVKALCEGVSVRGTSRLTGVGKQAILALLLNMGRVCLNHEDRAIQNVQCVEIQADEIWGFTHCKDRKVPTSTAEVERKGSVWTWYAVCNRSKMILSWIMGDRDQDHARAFMHDLAGRLACRPQLSTDALGMYAGAVAEAFYGLGVDYGQIHKIYSSVGTDERRYSPARCIGCTKVPVHGNPNPRKVSTSGIERANLTLRMSQRRWTRLTNAHSKSFTHMEAAFALHCAFYNWVRPHATVKTTPAVAAGIADRAWTVEDLVGLLEAEEAAAVGTEKNKRGPYRKRNA